MSTSIRLDTGLIEYTFTGVGECKITFNPTDVNFLDSFIEIFDTLEAAQKNKEEEVKKAVENGEVFKIAKKYDKEIRELIDGVFEAPICEKLFGTMNTYALSGGLPLWTNFMLAVLELVDSSFIREQKATNPRIQQYMKKYKKS